MSAIETLKSGVTSAFTFFTGGGKKEEEESIPEEQETDEERNVDFIFESLLASRKPDEITVR